MPAKRIILMYISEVSGHHSATIAVENAIKTLSPDTKVLNINTFNYTNPISEKIINRLYIGIIKATPGIWDYLYDNPKVAKKLTRIKNTVHKFNSPKLKKLFDSYKPDVIACTQAFPCGMVADFKRSSNCKIPLVGILTDYIPHSYWVYNTVDYYITPSEEISQRLINKGVEPQKVLSLGIPFDPKFNNVIPKGTILKQLGLNPQILTILIMGGGQGLGPIKTIVNSLEKMSLNIQEIIVTGTNKKLFKALKKKAKKSKKKIIPFGYSNKIEEFMAISDIIITKPGGITSAEALSKKLPMIIVKPIPGQETSNTAYLIEKQAAIKIDDPKKVNLVIEDLLLHREKLSHLADSAEKISKPNASFDIAKYLINLSND
ncbi:MAG: glycosyltransferase [Candidatus Omnitrophota bacterium]